MKTPAKKSNAPLYLLGGTVLGLIAWLASRSSSSPTLTDEEREAAEALTPDDDTGEPVPESPTPPLAQPEAQQGEPQSQSSPTPPAPPAPAPAPKPKPKPKPKSEDEKRLAEMNANIANLEKTAQLLRKEIDALALKMNQGKATDAEKERFVQLGNTLSNVEANLSKALGERTNFILDLAVKP